MIRVRSAVPDDIDALYAISLATGHHGHDASQLYRDPKMMGHIYSAPYLKLQADLTFVLDDEGSTVGFAVGTLNTARFERDLEDDWWPRLREIYSRPDASSRELWNADERRSEMIHCPELTPRELLADFPGHLHLNIQVSHQGRGFGSLLFETWLDAATKAGLQGVHIGTNRHNAGAVVFWQRMGFARWSEQPDLENSRVIWMTREVH